MLDEASIDAYLSACPPLGGLVLNAGINEPSEIADTTDETYARIMATNLHSSFRLVRSIAPQMRSRGFGRIVLVSSLYAGRSREGRGVYAMTKAALESLARSLTVEYAGHNVLTNAVALGFVDTSLTRRNNDDEQIARITQRIPVGRLASTQEVARVVSNLLSPNNSYVTGSVITVDGGWSCT